MPFGDFLSQFEKGLHPKFRQLYYILKDANMNQDTLKGIVQKLHRSQESMSRNNDPTDSFDNYQPRFGNYRNPGNQYQRSFGRKSNTYPDNLITDNRDQSAPTQTPGQRTTELPTKTTKPQSEWKLLSPATKSDTDITAVGAITIGVRMGTDRTQTVRDDFNKRPSRCCPA
ncbi:hypothetical protein ABEB36_013541 [Hypothenemus hampei]|uniref:Reverse transcriptase domain-containing protein n=1 Tax=Hypothenemus hampei TaxID=57062 RepID=A0ABD1E4I0_HYPHA